MKRQAKNNKTNPFRHCNLYCEGCPFSPSCSLYHHYQSLQRCFYLNDYLKPLEDLLQEQTCKGENKIIVRQLVLAYTNQKKYFRSFLDRLEEFLLHICALHDHLKQNEERQLLHEHVTEIFQKSLSNILLLRIPILQIAGNAVTATEHPHEKIVHCYTGIERLIAAWIFFMEKAPNFEESALNFLSLLKKAQTEIEEAVYLSTDIHSQFESVHV